MSQGDSALAVDVHGGGFGTRQGVDGGGGGNTTAHDPIGHAAIKE